QPLYQSKISGHVPTSISDVVAMLHGHDQDMSVPVLSSPGGSENRLHHLVHIVVVNDHVDLHFDRKPEGVLMPQPHGCTVRLRGMIVPFRHVQTVDPHAVQRLFDLVQFARPDEATNQFHTIPLRLTPPHVAKQRNTKGEGLDSEACRATRTTERARGW